MFANDNKGKGKVTVKGIVDNKLVWEKIKIADEIVDEVKSRYIRNENLTDGKKSLILLFPFTWLSLTVKLI